MNKKLLTLFFIIICSTAYAQTANDDIIVKNDGTQISAKIISITDKEVLYVYPDETGVYVMSKDRIKEVIFSSGRKEEFDNYSRFLGHWKKIAGNYYFNGSLSSLDITMIGKDYFVSINGHGDAVGESVAVKEDGKLKVPVFMSGDKYLVLIEDGTKIRFLGDTFLKSR